VLVEVGLLHSHSATDDILADLTVALRMRWARRQVAVKAENEG